ncbi:uncharacterized protein DS421_9g274740 [Arachis hypogaea]|nr:uncharacterized protein DS421_9g274740 [Arachis hypogaea]
MIVSFHLLGCSRSSRLLSDSDLETRVRRERLLRWEVLHPMAQFLHYPSAVATSSPEGASFLGSRLWLGSSLGGTSAARGERQQRLPLRGLLRGHGPLDLARSPFRRFPHRRRQCSIVRVPDGSEGSSDGQVGCSLEPGREGGVGVADVSSSWHMTLPLYTVSEVGLIRTDPPSSKLPPTAVMESCPRRVSGSEVESLAHDRSGRMGKSTPFLSPLGLRIPTVEQTIPVVEEKRCGNANDQRVFERFKQTEEKEDFVGFLCADELENSVSVADESQESRKRKNPFEGGIQSQTVRNNVVVLGGESKFKQKGQKAQIEINSSNKKPKPLYNHYANGRGWWDYDMEGVDNEELGFSEVWEGVGSTTLGGIADWH